MAVMNDSKGGADLMRLIVRGDFSPEGIAAARNPSVAMPRQEAPSVQQPRMAQPARQPQQARVAPRGQQGQQRQGSSPFGGLGSLFMPERAQRNRTVELLQQQGVDPTTATLLAADKRALQSYLLDRSQGRRPEYNFMNVDGTLIRTDNFGNVTPMGQFGTGASNATDDIREYQFARQNGYEGSFADWRSGGAAKPSAIQEYEYAKAQGFPGTFQDWEASKKGGMSLQVGPDGAVQFSQGNIKPMTEGQSKDTVYATRAEGALPLIDQYGEALTRFDESLGARVPFVGNYMKSDEFQQAEQAGKEFLQAILRKDTGAAITNEETAEYGTVYLPRPGDSPAVLEQKRQSRQRALEAIKAGMPPQAILAQEKALARTGGAPQGGQDWQDLGNGTRIRRVQ